MLFIRAEAAGVVIGKQGWVLNRIRKQSNARIQLLREELRGQRPCIIEGPLPNILRAEKHVFDLVAAVPVATAQPARRPPTPKALPRTRLSAEPFNGVVVRLGGAISLGFSCFFLVFCGFSVDFPSFLVLFVPCWAVFGRFRWRFGRSRAVFWSA